jgi:outer membrane lipoprotein-sorting protein
MRRSIIAAIFVVFLATAFAPAQNLEAVLNAMDKAAANFHTAQTDFVWDGYQRVVEEHEIQQGKMYFRRQNDDVQMAADITTQDKEKKYVLFDGSMLSVYLPKAGQVTEYKAGKNKADFETFLVLGFGGRGHDLGKSFEVKYAGMERVQGVDAGKLELTPKSQKVSNMFQTITLWIDMARGVSVQQLFDEREGNYRLAKYNNIQLNQKINSDVFKLKTSGKVTYLRPNS